MEMCLPFSFCIMIMLACYNPQAQLYQGDDYSVTDNRDDTEQSNRAHTDVGRDSQAKAQDRSIVEGSMLLQGYAQKKRRKRVAKIISAAAVVGARAVHKILRGAKMVADSKDVMLYQKSGGYERAFMDFLSIVQPGKFVNKRIQTSKGGKVGKVGDRVVTLEPGDIHTQATILITKPPTDVAQRASVDVIVYKY